MKVKTPISQNNFFVTYKKTSGYDRSIKQSVINYGQNLKQAIANNNNQVTLKLNEIATRIQKRVNRGTLETQNLEHYKSELKNLLGQTNFDIQRINIDDFFKCCILLSKHDTENETKINYFLITNKTNSLKILSETNHSLENIEPINPSDLDNLLSDVITPAHSIFNAHQLGQANVRTNSNLISNQIPKTKMTLDDSYKNNKFKFNYHSLSANKIKEEDEFALLNLESEKSKVAVKKISMKLADFLEKDIQSSKQNAFFYRFKNTLDSNKNEYPTPTIKEEITSFSSLIDMLRNHDNHVQLLGLMWPLFKEDRTGKQIIKIDKIYSNKIEPTKQYHEDLNKGKRINNKRFGNGHQTTSMIFSSQFFYPFRRSKDYITQKENSSNPILAKMEKNNLPFVSGISGMANLSCKILSKLHIHPYSNEGKEFCEAMSAFIVGSGMHSYYEVYKSFNLYAKKYIIR